MCVDHVYQRLSTIVFFADPDLLEIKGYCYYKANWVRHSKLSERQKEVVPKTMSA
jgi:hypothetical protein